MYHDEDDINEILGEQYNEWLDETYTLLQIEEGEVKSFEDWFDEKKQYIADCYADDYEELA